MLARTRVLIFDGQEPYHARLASELKKEPDIAVVGEPTDGHEDWQKILDASPQVILLDPFVAGRHALEVISKICATLPQTRILAITASERPEDVFTALASGAQGYLLKRSLTADIAQAVRKAAAGEVVLSPGVADTIVKELRRKVGQQAPSKREAEILKLLSEGLSTREIAKRLVVSQNTVKTHVYRLREKLKLKTRQEVSVFAARHHLSQLRIAERLSAADIEAQLNRGQVLVSIPHHVTPNGALPATGSPRPSEQEVLGAERKLATALSVELDWSGQEREAVEPDKIEDLLQECLDQACEEVEAHGGTVAWFTGGGLVALFGAPVADEHAPQKALHAALGIRKRVMGLSQTGIFIDARSGINSGTIFTKRSASGLHPQQAAGGGTVDLAAKARNAAEPGTVVVTKSTYDLTWHEFAFEPVGELWMREPVSIYRLVGLGPARSQRQRTAARDLSRFVGRRKKIEAMVEALDKAKSGSGQVVGIVGEAGIGKSRLLLEFREEVAGQEVSYLEGSCIYYGKSIPYLPFLRGLRYYFDIAEGEEPSVATRRIEEKLSALDNRLVDMLPPLEDVLSLKVDDESYLGLEPQNKKDRVFEAIRGLLIRESQHRPLIVAVEDLHWADPSTEEFLAYFIDKLANNRILLVLLYRPEYVHAWASKPCYSQLRVEALSAAESAELVRHLLGDGEPAPELIEFVVGRTQGNPLHIEEIIRTLRENGLMEERDHRYVLTVPPSDVIVPHAIQGIIGSRIDRLEPAVRRAIQAASVIGRDFSYRILQTITEAGPELRSHLRCLQSLDLIYEKGLSGESEYVFKHALTRDVVYESLSLKKRRAVHQRIGRAIEEQHPDTLEEFYEALAHHCSEAVDPEKAYQYLRLSGDKAYRNHSMSESFSHYQEALNVLTSLPGTEHNRMRRVELTLLIWQPMLALGFKGGSLEILQEGRRLAEEIGDSSSLAKLYAFIAHAMSFKGDSAQGLEYGQKSLIEAEKTGEIEAAVRAATNVSGSLCFRGDFAKAAEIAEKGIVLIEKNGRTADSFGAGLPLYPALMVVHGYSKAMLGDFEGGEPCCEQMIRFATDAKHLRTMAVAEVVCGLVSTLRGRDLESCFKHLQNGVRYSKETGFSPYLALAWTCTGWAHWLQGNLDMARDCAQKAVSTQSEGGTTAMSALTHLLLGAVSLDSGDLPKAQTSIEEALRLSQANGEKYIEGRAGTWLGRVLGKADISQAAAAEEQILRGISLLEEMKVRPWQAEGHLLAGELYADIGQTKKALASLKKAQRMFQEMGMVYWLDRTRAVLSKLNA